ncbi:MAG: hypothetical protein ABSC23_21920 [Bryobacteraceae bacterium]|jgi:hypothetical protein
MRSLSRCIVVLLVSVWPSLAGNVSYVVLASGDLVRIPDDGRSATTLAAGVGGRGLAIDRRGDYIVACISSLVRVTASGVVTQIAAAPAGSGWLAVAVDPAGNYIVGDNRRHALWRVSPDGQSVNLVAQYPVKNYSEWEDVGLLVDGAGDCFVVEDNSPAAHLWRVDQAGVVTSLPLRGDRMTSATCIVEGTDGAYFVGSYRDQAIFRVTPTGDVSRFASVGGRVGGLARNPETGELVVALGYRPALRRVSADGSSVSDFTNLGQAYSVIAESGR